MGNSLFDTAPDFGQPIAAFKHCHEQIRKQLAALERLQAHLPEQSTNEEVQQTVAEILRYFTKAAPHHQQDLFPMLTATAKDKDAAVLQRLGPEIISEHLQMDQLWQKLETQLILLQTDNTANISHTDVSLFLRPVPSAYGEERSLDRTDDKTHFSDAQMTQLGTAMQRRRGISA